MQLQQQQLGPEREPEAKPKELSREAALYSLVEFSQLAAQLVSRVSKPSVGVSFEPYFVFSAGGRLMDAEGNQ